MTYVGLSRGLNFNSIADQHCLRHQKLEHSHSLPGSRQRTQARGFGFYQMDGLGLDYRLTRCFSHCLRPSLHGPTFKLLQKEGINLLLKFNAGLGF